MKRIGAVTLCLWAACSGSAGPRAEAIPEPRITETAIPPPGLNDPRQIGAVVTVVDRSFRWEHAERIPSDDVGPLEDTVRACVDELLPEATRPEQGHWMIAVSWTAYRAIPQHDAVDERALLAHDAAPRPLSDCVAERAPPPELDEGDQLDVLISIRTRGWIAHNPHPTPLDDPDRALEISVEIIADKTDHSQEWSISTSMRDTVQEAARACAAATSPVADRAPVTAWYVTIAWRNPDSSQSRPFGPSAYDMSMRYPYGAAPPGFEACVKGRVDEPRDLFGPEVYEIEAAIEVASRAFNAEHKWGMLGHGRNVP